MKYCHNCGKSIKAGQKVCTQCGTPVGQHRTTNSKDNHKKSKLPFYISIIVIIVLVLALFAAFKIIEAQLSPTKQANAISNDIKNHKINNLTKNLTSDGKALSKDETKAVYDYINETDSPERVADEIKHDTKEMKDNKASATSITVGDTELITISQIGKKWGLFKNYEFNVNKTSVTVVPEQDSTLSYKLNGETKKAKLSQNKTKTLGDFPIGIYDLKASQQVNNKKFDGAIHIDMSNSDEADLQFKQKRFTVSIDSISADSETLKLYINGEEQHNFDEYESQTFGPYSPDEKVEVYATTEVEGKQFKSNVKNVSSPANDEDEINVSLTFDDDAITDYEDKKDSESDDSDDSSNSEDEVTRDNVIDKVESYEGHSLDTDTYTYKEPEETKDGWGFSFTDKDGELAGSYTIDDDGYVTEYDEDGEEVDSGY